MNQPPAPGIDFRHIAAILAQRWRWCAAPALALTVLAAGYAAFKPQVWQARQALVVRDEAVGDLSRQGRFDNSYALKTAQETVLEVARHRAVVEAALQAAGPESGQSSSETPPSDEVRQLQESISVTAPKGAEFGQTEVIYLSVKARTRSRAVVLTGAVCDQLERRLQLLRENKAQSLIDELTRTLHLAKQDRDEATARLQAIEAEVGSDLGELRILSEVGAGDSNLRSALNQIKSDLRQATANQNAIQEQLELLQTARHDEQQLIATSGRLMESQPALRRLKDGLVDAQLRTAALSGSMSLDHPQVREALTAEAEVRSRLQRELEAAIAGLQADLQVARSQMTTYEEQLHEVTARLDRLASLRAAYSNLQAEVRQRGAIVEKAQQDLATARASRAAAASASLLTRLDAPLADDRPLGPSRALIVLAGLAGGVATGLGLVFLTAPAGRQWGRRWSDYLRHGRRATDHAGRRASDPRPETRGDNATPRRRGEDPPLAPSGEVPPRGRRATDTTPVHRAPAAPSPERLAASVEAPNPVAAPAPEPQPVAVAPAPAVALKTWELPLPAKERTPRESLTLTESLSRLVAEAQRQS